MKNIILILFCIPIFLFSQDCILPNGKYNVIPGEKFNYYPEYELEIKKDSAIIKKNNQINYYKIINEFCSFRFESFEPPDESGWTELEKILNKEPPYYNITKIDDQTFEFVLRVNLHVMVYSGKFIRIED